MLAAMEARVAENTGWIICTVLARVRGLILFKFAATGCQHHTSFDQLLECTAMRGISENTRVSTEMLLITCVVHTYMGASDPTLGRNTGAKTSAGDSHV